MAPLVVYVLTKKPGRGIGKLTCSTKVACTFTSNPYILLYYVNLVIYTMYSKQNKLLV
jgi:hypothetical protein